MAAPSPSAILVADDDNEILQALGDLLSERPIPVVVHSQESSWRLLAPRLHSWASMNHQHGPSHAGPHDDPTFRSYWRQIDAVPLLPAEEQWRLATAFARTRDPTLSRRLVAANLRLVVKIAHEYHSRHNNFADLVQEGSLGLMRAVEKFDPGRGVKLISYAGWWIRAYMMRFLMEQDQAVRMGTTRASRRAFCSGQGTPLDVSLDQPVNTTSDSAGSNDRRCCLDVLSDDDNRRPDRQAEVNELRNKFAGLLDHFAAHLDQRDQTLVQRRWLDDEPETLRQLGKELSLSGERVRQLEQVLFDTFRNTVARKLAT